MGVTDGGSALRVLCLEDSAPDAELVREALVRGDFEVDMDLAAKRDRFEELLAASPYDVILADFSLPGFDGHAALALAKVASPSTPFICVSGAIGEEATAELLKQGAADVVLKDHLTRLVPAVLHALDDRARRDALRESEERYRDVLEHGGVGVTYFSLDGRILLLNRRAVMNMGGAEASDFVGRSVFEIFGAEAGSVYLERIRKAAASAEPLTFEDHAELPVGSRRLVSVHTRSLDAAGTPVGVHVYAQDITELKEAEAKAAQAAEHWQSTFDAMNDSVVELDAEGVVLRCNAATAAMTGHKAGDIVGRPCHEVFHGSGKPHPDSPLLTSRSFARTETSILRQDGHWLRVTFTPQVDAAGRLHGGVHVASDVSELKEAEQHLLAAVIRQQRFADMVTDALSRAVEARDPYTAGHQRRVSEIGTAMARLMGLREETVHRVQLAGMLHDIGKIIIPSEILSKPGRLSEMEFALIKNHPQAAYDILRPIDDEVPIASVVLQHHERLDGSGYPAGLKGEAILLEARILAVADVVEAMISHRPYRAALPVEDAMAEIEDGAETRYDKTACEAVTRLFRTEGFVLDE